MKSVDDGAGAKVQEGQSDVKKDQGVSRAISVSLPPNLRVMHPYSQYFAVFH